MPAPALIFVAWVKGHLLADVDAGVWAVARTLVLGDAGANALAKALDRAIRESASVFAEEDASTGARILDGMIGAFGSWQGIDLLREIETVETESTVLGEFRASITSTLLNSGLNSLVPPYETHTQLEDLAAGVGIGDLIEVVTDRLVWRVKTEAIRSGSPLTSLSDQLNHDATQEKIATVTQLASDTRGLAVITQADVRMLLQLVRSLTDTPSGNPAIVTERVVLMFESMKNIHRDYLKSFANAERMIVDGSGTHELVAFLESRRADLAASRLEQRAHAEGLSELAPKTAGDATNAMTEFGQSVLDYFADSGDGLSKITYYTGFLKHVRDRLEMAAHNQRDGPQDISDYRHWTADDGRALLSTLAGTRTNLESGFKRVADAFAALKP